MGHNDITARRAENRKKFPAVTKIVDEFRAAFGDGVTVVWAEEGGHVVGKKPAQPLCRAECQAEKKMEAA